jgi:hypothetical protein
LEGWALAGTHQKAVIAATANVLFLPTSSLAGYNTAILRTARASARREN